MGIPIRASFRRHLQPPLNPLFLDGEVNDLVRTLPRIALFLSVDGRLSFDSSYYYQFI